MRQDKHWLFYIAISFIAALPIISARIYLPLMPVIAHDLRTSNTNIKLSYSLYFLAFGFMQFFYGLFADKFGRRHTLLYSLALFFLGDLLSIFSTNGAIFVISRIAQGAGIASITSLMLSLGADSLNEKDLMSTTKNLSIVRTVASMFSPLLGVYISMLTNWRSIFIFLAAITLLAGLVILLAVENVKKPLPKLSKLINFYFTFIFRRDVLALLVPLTCMYSLTLIFSVITPILFQQDFKINSMQYAIISFIVIPFYAFGAFFSTFLVRYIGKRKVFFLSIFCSLASSVCLISLSLYYKKLIALLIPCAIIYFFVGMVTPMLMSGILKLNSKNNPTISGFIGGIQMVSISALLVLSSMHFMHSILSMAILYLSLIILSLIFSLLHS